MTPFRRVPHPTALRRLLTFGLLVPAAIGISTAQARAAGETLSLVQNDPAAAVGHATNFTASGTLNPDDTMFGFDIYIFLKDADRDSTCAADFDTESAAALHSGGHESWVAPSGGFQVGTGPTFNQPFKITFTSSGNYLLCGYVQGDFSTFASNSLRGAVAPSPATTVPPPTTTPPSSTTAPTITTPTAAVPAVVHAPWITRKRHVLTCHAGTWSNTPTDLSYRWNLTGRSKKRIASGPKLTVRRALTGRKVTCTVIAKNAAGTSTVSTHAVRAH